jgi:S1-C subfamily serine protease
MICPQCGTVHHASCWSVRGGCGAYACAPARRAGIAQDPSEPVLLITHAELERAVPQTAAGWPLRAAPSGSVAWSPASGPSPARAPVRTSRLAIASLVCGLAGILLFGLLTGLVAILLAVLALSGIRVSTQRGIWLAISGLFLGIVDVVGWIIMLGVFLSRPGPDLHFAEQPPDPSVIQDLEPTIQRAMRANVLIERSGGLAALGGKAIGSGVILRIDRGEALIVTNRHVVDNDFPSSNEDTSTDRLARLDRLTVRVLGQPDSEGQVVWMAPGQIDLALVRTALAPSGQAQAAAWQKGRPLKVGESVFAIGNPHHLGWSYSQGGISQLRSQVFDSRRVRVIQTSAAINPGNSGGGLYDHEGYCIGINTWTGDKRVSEGIGFAIALDTLVDLAPAPLKLPVEKTAKAKTGR